MYRNKYPQPADFVPENWEVHFGSQSVYVSAPQWAGNPHGASTGSGLVHLMTVMGGMEEAVGVAVAEKTVRAVNAFDELVGALTALNEDRRIALGSTHRKRIAAALAKASK